MDIKHKLFENSYHLTLIGLGLGVVMALHDYLALDLSQNVRFAIAGVIAVSGYVSYEKYKPRSTPKPSQRRTPATPPFKQQRTQTPEDIYHNFVNKRESLKNQEE